MTTKLLIIVYAWAMLYLFGCLAEWSFNPATWHLFLRIIIALAMILWAIGIVIKHD